MVVHQFHEHQFHGMVCSGTCLDSPEIGHDGGGFEVGGVFLAELVGFLADEEGEVFDVLVEVLQEELDGGGLAGFGLEALGCRL